MSSASPPHPRATSGPPHVGPRPYEPARNRGFQALIPPPVWADLLHTGRHSSFRRGDQLVRQGLRDEIVVALRSGRTKVVYTGPDGSEALIAVRGRGDLQGEFGATDAEGAMATVVALEPCAATVLAQSAFVAFIRHNRLDSMLSQYMLRKTRQTGANAWRAARLPAEQRMAYLFLDVIAVGEGDERSRRIPMTQDEIALAVGCRRSNVARILREWKRQSIVETGQRHLLARDTDSLRTLAEGA